jgi:putative endonuclease
MLWCVHLNILNLFTVCWFLYLVRTADNALYTGITTDVARRFLQHQTGKGAKALRGKGELQLAFTPPSATGRWRSGWNTELNS